MKTKRRQPVEAFTVLEMFIVVAVLFDLLAVLLPSLNRHSGVQRMSCINNQKQIGLAFKTWALDNNDCNPMHISLTNGGTMELASGPNAFVHFRVMSNELSTPKILLCPEDRKRRWATNFGSGFGNSNISYFGAIDAVDTITPVLLSGDRNLKGSSAPVNGMLTLLTNSPVSWTRELHDQKGNLLLTDGSVQQVDDRGLRDLIFGSGMTNRLAMP